MHGLINRSFESFLRITYGASLWAGVVEDLDIGFDHFEPVLHYDDDLSYRMLDSAAARLGKSPETLLEDFGTFLVAAPATERVRRLLRFGGVDYEGFLASLEDLRGRARLAVPDLDLPQLDLEEQGGGLYRLVCRSPHRGFGHVYLGLLRALADDYGALVLIDFEGETEGAEVLSIRLADADFAEGRAFDLANRAAG
ncbi:MAG: heme NO-binding domain-containing protein [Maritimibacter sp.]|nr:heme NO-binding domain-containing protein [Maritimibacter sp.]